MEYRVGVAYTYGKKKCDKKSKTTINNIGIIAKNPLLCSKRNKQITMIKKNIRLIFGGIFLIAAIAMFIKGIIGWGVMAVLTAGIFILLHFKNEMNLMAFLFVRKNNFDKAELFLSKVKHPENLVKSQEAYHYFLTGLVYSQKHQISKAEKSLKKAVSVGLRMKNDQAMAKLNLASIYLSKRNKKLAAYYLKDAKQLDKQKVLTTQIKEIEHMMKRI